MMDKLLLFVLLIVLVFALIVCGGNVQKTEDNEIENYVRNELKLDNFKVSENYVEKMTDPKLNPSKVWTVTAEDGVKFFVVEEHFFGLFGEENHLVNDFDNRALALYLSDFKKTHNTKLSVQLASEYESIGYVSVQAQFSSVSELESLLNDLNEFQNYCLTRKYQPRMGVSLSNTSSTGTSRVGVVFTFDSSAGKYTEEFTNKDFDTIKQETLSKF